MNYNINREGNFHKILSLLKKLAANAGFYFDNIKNKFLESLFSNKSKEKNRRISRKIFNHLPDKTEELAHKRKRYQRPLQRRIHNPSDIKANKFSDWLKKKALIIGNIKISRMGVIGTIFIILALASGTFALASNIDNRSPVMDEVLDVRNSKLIYITYNDETYEIETLANTVQEVISENDILIGDNDAIKPSLNSSIYSKMNIVITKPFQVYITYIDDKTTIDIASGTVKNALDEAGIMYDDDDRIVPELDTVLSAGLEITFDEIRIEEFIEEEKIEYETEYGETETVLAGLWAISQKGKDGLKVKTISVTYLNGVEDSREIISEVIIKEPVNKIILNGTGTKRAGEKKETESSSGGDDYESIQVTNPNQQATNPSIPAGPGSYIESVVAHVTAYTHTGSKTATGTWPRSTRTLENPGSSAVAPQTFPYGTLFYIPGYGYSIAEDTGGFRNNPDRWNQIDLFMNTESECRTWGRRREWTVYVLRRGY